MRITTDSSIQKAIFVHISHTDGIILLKFQECRDGLYYIDMKIFDIEDYKTKSEIINYSSNSDNFCLLNRVEFNKSLYNKQQIKKSELAR